MSKRPPEKSILCQAEDEELRKKKLKDLRKIRYQDDKLLERIKSAKESLKNGIRR